MSYMPTEGAKSTLRVIVARGVASALVGGFAECAEEGRPLNEKQKATIVEMALMSYADVIDQGEKSLDAEALIHGLVGKTPTKGER